MRWVELCQCSSEFAFSWHRCTDARVHSNADWAFAFLSRKAAREKLENMALDNGLGLMSSFEPLGPEERKLRVVLLWWLWWVRLRWAQPKTGDIVASPSKGLASLMHILRGIARWRSKP